MAPAIHLKQGERDHCGHDESRGQVLEHSPDRPSGRGPQVRAGSLLLIPGQPRTALVWEFLITGMPGCC